MSDEISKAWEDLRDKAAERPSEMTALDWALWNSRAGNPTGILFSAAAELADLRQLIADMNTENEAATGNGYGAWMANSEIQTRIDKVLGKEQTK